MSPFWEFVTKAASVVLLVFLVGGMFAAWESRPGRHR